MNKNEHKDIDDLNLFGEKIRKIRELNELSRGEFSLALNVPSTTIRGIEQGNHKPSYKFIKAISSNPMFRKYLLWLLCEPWDELDDRPDFPTDIEQIKPDIEKEREIEALKKIISDLETALEKKTK